MTSKNNETLHKKVDDMSKKLDHIQMLIIGNPPYDKGIFQRLDETNGKVKFNRIAIYVIGGLLIGLLAGNPQILKFLLAFV